MDLASDAPHLLEVKDEPTVRLERSAGASGCASSFTPGLSIDQLQEVMVGIDVGIVENPDRLQDIIFVLAGNHVAEA